ncbi:RICIN domain-containing protein [Lentzea sp. NPDC003310]|uniref:RICIN domain-containing protein n=1 Tax=Lentzea sp. NPDC003310 TaxID=3154447 RepID=UPI0033AB5D36
MSRSSLGGRCMRAIAALAVVSTFVSGPGVGSASADPRLALAVQAAPETSVEQKAAAARLLKIQVTPEIARMTDQDFVILLWDTAQEPDNSRVKAAAAAAFTAQSRDNTSCYRFITEGIFAAHQADNIDRLNRAERIKERRAAAQFVSWTLDATDEQVSLKDFVFRLWTKAKEDVNPEIRSAALAMLAPEATDEQRQEFVATGVKAANDRDIVLRTEKARLEREAAERKRIDEARRADAWSVVTRGEALPPNKLNITYREFTYELVGKAATGSIVKADAQTAVDTCGADAAQQACKDFIYTGVHRSHQLDLEERDRLAAIQTEKDIKRILAEAEKDGYLPFLVVAAKTALAGDLVARNRFLNTGQFEARKRDRIKPENRRVIELKGAASGLCIQTVGLADSDAHQANQVMELWECLRGGKQVWELYDLGDGHYLLQNLNSKKCLTVVNDSNLAQNNCDANVQSMRWKFIENESDGTYQLQNIGTGRFAAVAGGGLENAALVVLAGNTNDGHQRWRIIDPSHRSGIATVNAGVALVKGVESGRCMQTAGYWDTPGEGALADLAAQELWDCVGGGKMSWTIEPLGNNKYALKNVMSGKCLDVKWGEFANGTQLVQFSCHYGGTQQFVFTDAGNGQYGLQSVLTAQYADAEGHAVHNGALVKQWDYTGLSNQKWTLHYA